MPRNSDPDALSELEREFEFEFEMDDARGGEREADDESFADDRGEAAEFEFDDAGELEYEYEADEDSEYESDAATEHAERFFELSQREFESEAEADAAVNELLAEMEPEYFFGSLKSAFNKAKRAVGRVSRSPIGGLIKKGIETAGGQLPAFQALKGITALARGDMRGLLAQLAKSGLGAALPGAGPFLPMAMKAMGFEAGAAPEENREAWNSFVAVSREAYQNLANNLNERVDDPLEASRLANAAFQQALRSAPVRARGGRSPSRTGRGGRRVVLVRPGEEIVVRVRRM